MQTLQTVLETCIIHFNESNPSQYLVYPNYNHIYFNLCPCTLQGTKVWLTTLVPSKVHGHA